MTTRADAAPNIILTGFMGTGKTSVGRRLAETLGYSFVDSDALIESRYGSIASIFDEQGEAGFRTIEREVAYELATCTRSVIATGGRLMLDDASATVLGQSGDVVCLSATLETLIDRLVGGPDSSVRPLLVGGQQPEVKIAELLDQRAEHYAAFPQVETDDRSLDEVVSAIVQLLELNPVHRLPPADS